MNLDPALGRTDRIASLAAGVGAIVYAWVAVDSAIARVVLTGLGVALAIGGIGGT